MIVRPDPTIIDPEPEGRDWLQIVAAVVAGAVGVAAVADGFAADNAGEVVLGIVLAVFCAWTVVDEWRRPRRVSRRR